MAKRLHSGPSTKELTDIDSLMMPSFGEGIIRGGGGEKDQTSTAATAGRERMGFSASGGSVDGNAENRKSRRKRLRENSASEAGGGRVGLVGQGVDRQVSEATMPAASQSPTKRARISKPQTSVESPTSSSAAESGETTAVREEAAGVRSLIQSLREGATESPSGGTVPTSAEAKRGEDEMATRRVRFSKKKRVISFKVNRPCRSKRQGPVIVNTPPPKGALKRTPSPIRIRSP